MASVDISGLRLNRIEPTGITVRWSTSVPADSCVQFEPVLSYGASPARDRDTIALGPDLVYHGSYKDPRLVTEHEVVLGGLRAGSGYYLRARSSRGDMASSWRDVVFMTRAEEPPARAVGSRLKELLLKQADALVHMQRVERQQIHNLADLQAYQSGVRAKFLRSLGGLPDKTPLNPRVVRVIDRGDYAIENIVFESLPGFFVPGNLYRPKSLSRSAPGILGLCGHALAGKSEPQVIQMTDINLARKGYVVLQIDPPGQNEMGWDGTAWSFLDIHYNGSGYAHSLMALSALLVGQSLTRYFLWNGIRAIDYLISRPEVDAERIGVWGCSGGGGQSMYIAAIDQRVKAAVPMCMMFDTVALMRGPYSAGGGRGGGSFLTEETYPNTALSQGLSYTSILSLIAPRALTIVGAAKEGIPLSAIQAPYEELKAMYDRVGASDQLGLGLVQGYHCEHSVRQFAYWTFNRSFGKESEGLHEVDEGVLPSSVGADGKRQATPLDVAPHSSVVQDFGSATVHTLFAEKAAQLARERPTPATYGGWEPYCDETRRAAAACLRLEEVQGIVAISQATVERDGFTIRRLACRVELGIVLRMELYEPSGVPPRGAILYLRNQVPSMGDLLAGVTDLYDLIGTGHIVLAAEVRGLNDPGLLEDATAFGISTHHTRRVHEALAVGRPLLGQRVGDVLAAVRVLGERKSRNGIVVIGDGLGGLWGVYAAVFEKRIVAVAVRDSLSSYQRIMETPFPTWVQNDRESSIAIPGALRSFDLPDIVSLLAPRHVRISRSVDGANHILPLKDLRDDYARALAQYEAQGVGGRFVLSESNDLTGWEGLDAY